MAIFWQPKFFDDPNFLWPFLGWASPFTQPQVLREPQPSNLFDEIAQEV